MAVFTKRAVNIFAPTDASGRPRQPVLDEAATWGTEMERGLGDVETAVIQVDVEIDSKIGSEATARQNADAALQAQIEDLEVSGDTVTKATWAELSAHSGSRAGQRGYVENDAGTHTDPVTSATVPNQGIYTWVASQSAWQWLRKDDLGELQDRSESQGSVLGSAYSAISVSQVVGTTETPVSATTLGNITVAFANPATMDGFVTRVAGYALASGSLAIKRFTRAGDVFTQVGNDYVVSVPAGLFSIDLSGMIAIPVNEGEYLGFYGFPMVGRSAVSTTIDVPFYNSATGSGNVSSFTDAAVQEALRPELRFVVEKATVTEARVSRAEANTRLALLALGDILGQMGSYSPALVFLDHEGYWLDAADKTSIFQDTAGTTPVLNHNDGVALIKDKAGYGFDFIAQPGQRPIWKDQGPTVPNGQSVITFQSTGRYFTGQRRDFTRARDKATIIVVSRNNVTSGQIPLIHHSTNANANAARMAIGNMPRAAGTGTAPGAVVRQTDGDTSTIVSSPSVNPGQLFVAMVEADFLNGDLRYFFNGQNYVEGVQDLPDLELSQDALEAAVYLGGNPNATNNWFTGEFCEAIAFIGSVDDQTLQRLHNYLSAKWDVSLKPFRRYSPTGEFPGAWIWFNDPRVLALSQTRAVVGGVTGGGSVMAADFDNGNWQHVMFKKEYQRDDHDNPSFATLADGRIIAAYTDHGSAVPDTFYIRRSTNPGDPLVWDAEVNIADQFDRNDGPDYSFNYANIFRLAGESNRLYLVFREGVVVEPGVLGDEYWCYSTSDDNGATWTPATRIAGPDRPYLKVRQNGNNRLDFLINDGHPGAKPLNNTYHFYMQGGNFYKTDGTLIGNSSALPLDLPNDATHVYDAVAGARSWVWDIVIGGSGPVACFQVMSDNFMDIRYHQARWNGSAWVHHEICDAGRWPGAIDSNTKTYSGGVITDPDNMDVVYCSRQVDGSGNIDTNGIHHLYRYTTSDGGQTWTGQRLTSGSETCIRPYIPEGMRKLFYQRGRYTSFTDYDTVIDVMDIS